MGKALTNEEFLDKLKNKNIFYTPLETYINNRTKIKFLCDNNHIFNMEPRALFDGQRCPYCSGNKVWKGFNDFATTHHNLAEYLKNKEDGYCHSYGSNKIVDWICPNCGSLIKASFHCVVSSGLSCKKCSNGISYPEKFVSSLLKQLNVDFLFDKSRPWSNKRRYDFYLEEHNTIIETHGRQHYKNGFYTVGGRSTEEEVENDAYKKELALQNGISNYIELDCSKSNLEFIKLSILNSDIANIFNLSNIDWNMCDVDGYKNWFVDILTLWNNGIKNTVEISNILKIDRHSVLKYLKSAAGYGLCDYDQIKERKIAIRKMRLMNSKKVICSETGQVFNSIQDAAESCGLYHQGISACCRHERKTCGGYHWEFYNEGAIM